MKKILTSIFALGIALSLSACFGAKTTSDDSGKGSEGGKTEQVLEDKNSYAWAVHGNHLLADETPNGWNGKDNELYEASKMTAISKEESKRLGVDLTGKDVKYLYKYEGIILGTNDSGWKANFKKDGKMYKANGSYCFKAVKLSYDAEEEVYAEEQWIPHDHDGHTEALTSNLWVSPTFAEEPDADGFSWDYNPVAMEAGVFTLIVAEYNAAPSATVCNYGIGLVKTAEKEGIAFEEIVEWVAEDHTYGVIGSFNEWGADAAMTQDGQSWKAVVTLEANAEFKVRADGAWDNAWGAAVLDTTASSAHVGGTDNLVVDAAGSYQVAISFPDGAAKIVVTEVA